MSETEKKEMIRYSQYIEVDRMALKAYTDRGEEMPEEEIKKAIADASRIEIAQLFYMMGRHYADHDLTADGEFTWKTDMPLPPTEIIISVETQLWDTRIVMKVVEK